MRTPTLWAGLVVALSACSGERATPPADYAGLTIPPLPEGLAAGGRRAFPESDGVARYTLDLVFGSAGQMLWLSRAVSEAEPAAAREVAAVLEIPSGEKNVTLIYAPGSCSVEGEADLEVVALVRVQGGGEAGRAVLAWRANRAAARFDVVPAASVRCARPEPA